MSNIVYLFDQQDIKLFFDRTAKKLVLKKQDVYYNINLNSENIGEETLKQQIENIYCLINAMKISGKVGPTGPTGPRGKQGIVGPKGEKGPAGKSFEIKYFLDSESELPDNVEEGSMALVKNSLNLFIMINEKWNIYGNLKLIEGPKGDKGDKGDKGEIGNNLQIDYFVNSVLDLDVLSNIKQTEIALVRGELALYIYINNKWDNFGNLLTQKGEKGSRGEKGKQGEKGDKGDKGDAINFSFIVSNRTFLPNKATEHSYALVRNTLNVYYYFNDKWDNLGTLKGDKGDKGDTGSKGDTGNMGPPFTVKYSYDNIDQFNNDQDNINPDEYDYMIDKSKGNVYQFVNNNWEFKFNLKGEKGDVGNGLEIDYIVSNTSELFNITDANEKFAIEKNAMNLFYNEENKWNFIGNLKGEKGEKGDKGLKGEVGQSLKIDHYINNINNLLDGSLNFNAKDIIYIRDTNEVKYWDGSLLYDVASFPDKKIRVTDIDLVQPEECHQNFKLSRLFEIKMNLDKISNTKLNELNKIKVIICWKSNNEDISRDFYKEGMLFFAEHNDKLIHNSTQYIHGFPMANTFIHEFLVKNMDLKSMRFFINVNYYQGTISLLDNCNLIEINQLTL